ncbi:phytoene desaturase family protein [Shouchella sp. 1P09AA]|uniref:phytoene desaturase family protein n=1 Tax=unclassified Shouchella TaxID=2893065 RepID=UPI0039A266E7
MKSIVVGSGIGGLVTALYLSNSGDEVTVLEKNDYFGGRLAYHRHGEYKIDQGPTIVLLPEMITSILEESGMNVSSLDFVQIDPLYKMSFPDGASFWKYRDMDKQREEISKVFPGEEDQFPQFMKAMEQNFIKGKAAFLDKSFNQKRNFFTVSNLKTLYELKAYQSVDKMIRSYFSHERLQNAYKLQSLYIGGNPTNSSALYSLVSYSEHAHGIWYLKGGYAHLVEKIVEELKGRGVQLIKNAEVNEILYKGNVGTAVKVDNMIFEGDRFVMNLDFPLAEALVEQKEVKKKYVPSSGCLLVYAGLDKVYEESPIHQFLMSDDFDQHMKDVFEARDLSTLPSIYAFHPSVIDPSLAPEGKGVLYALIPIPAKMKTDDCHKLVETVLEQLEKRAFPDLQTHIEWLDVRTPKDAEAQGLYEGGSFGLAPTVTQSAVFRPQYQPFKAKNIYAVGASTHPGGGIPIVMQGVKLFVKELQQAAAVRG